MTDLPDEKLLELIQKDDKAAFSEIYNRYAAGLAAFCGPKLHQLEDAHDVLQDLFLKLWENRAHLNITTSLKSYLFAALRYRIIDKIRFNLTRENYTAMFAQRVNTADTGNPYEDLKAKDISQQIAFHINKLPPKTREIYLMSREKEYSIKEIAKLLNLSEQTVKNQITIALKHLRDITSMLLLLKWLNH